LPWKQIFLARFIEFRQVGAVSDTVHKHERHKMKPASANKIGCPNRPQTRQQAQIRIVILALVSFFLGVAATAFWFHFAPNRHVENSSSRISNSQMSGQPSAGQPVEPVINANQPSQPFVPSHPPVDTATIEEVKQAIPNFASVSLEDGTKILREAALQQFTAATKEMDAQVRQAQQQLAQAENGQSAVEQQAAMKHVQETQAEQTEKLQLIAARLQAQIAALKRLKGATP